MCHDVDTANHAGITSIAVLTGYDSARKLAESEPDVMVAHLNQLHDWFRRSDVFQQVPVSTVGALIFDSKNRVLMLRSQKWQNKWGIPGGKIRRGETSWDAVHREVREETGIDLESVEFLRTDDWIDPPEFKHPAHFLLLSYTGRSETTEVKLNEVAQDFVWLEPAAARELDLNTPSRSILEDWLDRQTSGA